MLDCDPLGANITLWCGSPSNITWFWSQNVSEAGVSGIEILSCDSAYQITQFNQSIGITFTVNESMLGYYWCEISNAVNVSLRPSTITPVCPPMNHSQQKCDHFHVNNHHTPECAEADSPTMISRPPLPTSCAVSAPSVSCNVMVSVSWKLLWP